MIGRPVDGERTSVTTFLPWVPGGHPSRPDVCIVPAHSYDPRQVDEAVRAALAPFGGMSSLVSPGARVLLKPNLLNAARPHRAVTTHPAVVAAVARQVLEAGGRVTMGDSPPGAVRGMERAYARSGLRSIADELGLTLAAFETVGAAQRTLDGMRFVIARTVLEADVVISVAKLKTHTLTLLTGAVKNLYGVQPGFAKGTWHTRFPRPADFVEVLLDLLQVVPPAFTIVDAIDCMDGEGPSGGRPLHRGRIVAGPDVLAVEAACAPILDVRPDELPVLRAAVARGALPEFLHIARPAAWHEGPHPARRPSYWAARHIPRTAAPLLQRALWVRAVIDEDRCTHCGACAPICPTGALVPWPGRPPEVIADACIGCLVCRSVCADDAIGWRYSPLARLVV